MRELHDTEGSVGQLAVRHIAVYMVSTGLDTPKNTLLRFPGFKWVRAIPSQLGYSCCLNALLCVDQSAVQFMLLVTCCCVDLCTVGLSSTELVLIAEAHNLWATLHPISF